MKLLHLLLVFFILDPGELRQVFSTLLLNATEAVDAGGTIAVRTRKASRRQNPAIPGLRVTIFDNGVGIPASNIPHIFEPFTKDFDSMEATLCSKGQATIPKAVRERLHLEPGDRFKFFFHPDGVIILPKIPTSRLKGIIPKPARPVSLEEIDAAIEAGATQRFRQKK